MSLVDPVPRHGKSSTPKEGTELGDGIPQTDASWAPRPGSSRPGGVRGCPAASARGAASAHHPRFRSDTGCRGRAGRRDICTHRPDGRAGGINSGDPRLDTCTHRPDGRAGGINSGDARLDTCTHHPDGRAGGISTRAGCLRTCAGRRDRGDGRLGTGTDGRFSERGALRTGITRTGITRTRLTRGGGRRADAARGTCAGSVRGPVRSDARGLQAR